MHNIGMCHALMDGGIPRGDRPEVLITISESSRSLPPSRSWGRARRRFLRFPLRQRRRWLSRPPVEAYPEESDPRDNREDRPYSAEDPTEGRARDMNVHRCRVHESGRVSDLKADSVGARDAKHMRPNGVR